MGKQGPCYHCGVTNTPLWRNGPPEKPVLCNACGSRWRTKGTLANYTPLHARPEPVELDGSKIKTISIKNDEARVLKRKFDNDTVDFGVVYADYDQHFHKRFDEDTSHRSSSGSAISNSESCAQNGSADASDLTGPSQPSMWDSAVPSRKRTCVARLKPSRVEKLTKDLYTIWHEQQSSCLSRLSEEDLLFESDKPMVSVEIGHGSVLIQHPSSIAREEESEASSLSVNNKQHMLNSQHMIFPGFIEDADAISNKGIGKFKNPANQGMGREPITREKDQLEVQILGHHDSPLCCVDLQDLNHEDNIMSEVVGGFKALETAHTEIMRRPRDGQHHKFTGSQVIIKQPKIIMKSSYDEKYCSFSSKKGLFSLQDDATSFVLDSEQDLLLDMPSNSLFSQAELLPTNRSSSNSSSNHNVILP